MLLQTQRYQLEVQYVPGKEVLVADVLSTAHLPTTQDTDHDMLDDCEVMIHSFLSSLPCSAVWEAQIQSATKQDSSLQDLSRIVLSGWPKQISQAPASVQPYWTARDEIHETDGLLFKGRKWIIPKSLLGEMIKLIHESH